MFSGGDVEGRVESGLEYVSTTEMFRKIGVLGSYNPSIDTYTHIFMPQGKEDDHGCLFSQHEAVNWLLSFSLKLDIFHSELIPEHRYTFWWILNVG